MGLVRYLRRFDLRFMLILTVLVLICVYVWNFSALTYTSGDSTPVFVASKISINKREVAGITPSEHAPAGLVLPREVTIERSQSLLPGVLPHATPSSSAPTRSSDPVDAKEEQNVVENKPVGNDDGAKPANPIAAAQQDGNSKTVEEKKEPSAFTLCPVIVNCASNQFSYYVQSGQGTAQPPIICYNNELVMGKGTADKTYTRGANIVVIHPKFKTIIDRRSFDLYESSDNCMAMARFLSGFVPFKGQILMASFDEMSTNLCSSVKTLLNQYGSALAKNLKFRDNFVLVGEKALPGNFGFEKVGSVPKGGSWPAAAVNVSGCATQPISPKYVDVDVINGYSLENCGVQKCGFEEIEIHIATGDTGTRAPKLCIGSTYIYYPGLKGSRGFNLVELDPATKTVIKTAEYDTYQVESSRLELFLENVGPKNFLIAIVADDGSVSLKQHARDLLKQFGFDGDLIAMRTVLYFVGRKGLKVTPVQKISRPDSPKKFAPPINERFCLPMELSEATVEQITSKARTEFCAKHQSFADFCFVHHKTEPLIPATKLTSYDAISEVFEVPILVLGGVNNIAMSHTLQSLLKQPGLNTKKVYVAYSIMFGDDYKPFIELFGFQQVVVKPISRYVEFLTAALQQFWLLNSDATHAIVIDDEVVAKPGFMWYMGHALKAMKRDSQIGAASAWNPQGFETVASDPSAVHVVSLFPGQAFLISKTFYEVEIKDREQECCSQRSIQQWFQSGTQKQYKYIIPEISRAGYFSPTAYSAQTQPLSSLAMSMPRTAASMNLTEVPLLMDNVYNFDTVVTDNLKSAYYVTERDMTICRNSKGKGAVKLLAPFLPLDKHNIAVVYSQARADDYQSLKYLYSCFGLMYMDGISPYGIYNGVTTVSLGNKRVYLVGTSSAYYKQTAQSLNPYVASF